MRDGPSRIISLDRAVGIHVRAALRGLGFRVSGVFDVLAPNTPKSGHASDADSSNPSRQVVQGLSPTSASAGRFGVGLICSEDHTKYPRPEHLKLRRCWKCVEFEMFT